MLQYTVTIEGTVTINGTSIALKSRNDLMIVKRYIDEYLRVTAPHFHGETAVAPTGGSSNMNRLVGAFQNPLPRGGFQPEPGNATKDILLRVLEAHPEGVGIHRLVELMKDANWQTYAVKPARALEVVMYKHPELFGRIQGRWVLVKNIHESEQHTMSLASDS